MKIKEYKKILEEITDMVSDGVQVTDFTGKVIIYNRQMENLEGFDRNDIVGKTVEEISGFTEEKKDRIKKAIHKNGDVFPKTSTRKDIMGRENNVLVMTKPVMVNNSVIATIEVARDDDIWEGISGETKIENQSKVYSFSKITSNEDFMRVQIRNAKKVATGDETIIICGDVGTGKEVFAKTIHYNSKRKSHPFISQSCKGIREQRIDEIIFGTQEGPLENGVIEKGILEKAQQGTIMLDGIENLSHEIQSKLLRALQENYIRRIGGDKIIPIDVRIIGTIGDNPQDLIAKGMLKKELFYRMSTATIDLPRLKERRKDILMLAEGFLEKECQRLGKKVPSLSQKATEKLEEYTYPGNIRELENVIISAVSRRGKRGTIQDDDIFFKGVEEKSFAETIGFYHQRETLDEFIKETEKKIVIEVLEKNRGNISKTADELGIKRQTLQHKIRKYGYNYRG